MSVVSARPIQDDEFALSAVESPAKLQCERTRFVPQHNRARTPDSEALLLLRSAQQKDEGESVQEKIRGKYEVARLVNARFQHETLRVIDRLVLSAEIKAPSARPRLSLEQDVYAIWLQR